MNKLPPLKALQAFEAAGRTGSFQKAAKELFVTPSAISHQVKSLESYLGITLFERRTRQISLTVQGEVYLETITKSFVRIEAATDSAIRGFSSRELKLAVAPQFLERWLLPRFSEFTNRYPDLEVVFTPFSAELDLNLSDIDMAIRFGDGEWEDATATLLHRVAVIPVCAPELLEMEHVMEPTDLLRFRLLQDINRPDDWQRWFQLSGEDFLPSQGGLGFPSGALAIHAAKAGLGVALAEPGMVSTELAEGSLMAPIELEMAHSKAYYLVSLADRPPSLAMEAFSDWILQKVERS